LYFHLLLCLWWKYNLLMWCDQVTLAPKKKEVKHGAGAAASFNITAELQARPTRSC
jgi:hypothetical protein